MGLHCSYDNMKRYPMPQPKHVLKPWHVRWVWTDTGTKDTLSYETEVEARTEAAKITDLGNDVTDVAVEYKEPFKRK